MEIRGYKAFNEDLSNRYGAEFKAGEIYQVTGPVAFGTRGNGFHFCKRLEDTLRYFDAMEGNVQIAEVIGRGNIAEYYDDYYGYYDMYAASELEVVKVLSREEILVPYLISANYDRVKRFVSGFRLTFDEKEMFRTAFSDRKDILQAIAYYQDGIKNTYDIPSVKCYFKEKNSGRGDNNE